MTRFDRWHRIAEASQAHQLLGAIFARYGLGDPLQQERVFTMWEQLVGRRIGKRTWPQSISRGVLAVGVANSSWLHQLSFMKDELLDQIHRGMKDSTFVTDIQFYLGRERQTPPHANRCSLHTPLSATPQKQPTGNRRGGQATHPAGNGTCNG